MLCGFTNHTVQQFNGIGGVDDFANLIGMVEEGDQVKPMPAPGCIDVGI